MLNVTTTIVAAIAAVFLAGSACGDDASKETNLRNPIERDFVTKHTLVLEGHDVSYTAIAGEIFLRDDTPQPTARVFSISYFRNGVDRPSRRPILFLFNGGPGSTAVWLNLGAFGPRRIVTPEKVAVPIGPPFELEPNPDSLLESCDLVFVDPIGTGFSRALGDFKDEDFWGVDEDAESMAQFIRRYLSKHKRWNSPKFLVGESYGSIRASLLMRELQLKQLNNVAFNGVILIGAANDAREFLRAHAGNPLPWVTRVPTYAATAFYHDALRKRPDDLAQFLQQAEEFASTEYLVALFRGQSLPAEQRRVIANRLSYFTGLSEEYLLRSNLRINRQRFLKELLRDRGQTLAVHDTRYVGRDPDSVGDFVESDPLLPGLGGAMTAAVHEYLTDELKVDIPTPYNVFSTEANSTWKRPKKEAGVFNGYLHTTAWLARAAGNNRQFRDLRRQRASRPDHVLLRCEARVRSERH